MVGATYNDILQLERPLTLEKLANYARDWFDKELQKQTFVTRAAHNKMLSSKTSAIVRVLKTLSPRNTHHEIVLRQKISEKCILNK